MSFPKKAKASKRSLSDSETYPADKEGVFKVDSKTPKLSDKTSISTDEPKQKDSKLMDEAPNEEVASGKPTEERREDDEVSTEKHSTDEPEKTKETTQEEKNDILEEILRSSPGSSDELEKAETFEISIEDSNLDGCDSADEKKKSNKSKCSSRLEEGEREEGELTPDHHCSVEEVAEAPEVKNSQEKENVPKESLQDILGSFYKNAKDFMETQNDHLHSSLLARLNWIVRHVEDVKGEISKEDLSCKELTRPKRFRSDTRQEASDVIRPRTRRSRTVDRTHGANEQSRNSNVLSSKQKRNSPMRDKSHKGTRNDDRSPDKRHPGKADRLQKDQKLHYSRDGQPRKVDAKRHTSNGQRERSSRTDARDDRKPLDLDTRKEAREIRHTKNRKEQDRIQSLVKRQMRIISHIVKKQHKDPLRREKEVWSQCRKAILHDEQHRRVSKSPSPIRKRPLNNLDDMESFLDDLRSKKNAGRGDRSERLSRLDKELAHLANVFEGHEQFLSRDDMDIYKYKYSDEKPKEAMVFTSRKEGKGGRPNRAALKVIGDGKPRQEPEQNSKLIEGRNDGIWRLLQSNASKIQQSPVVIERDEIRENIVPSASEQRALKRKALLDEKDKILQKVSEKREAENKTKGDELYNPSDLTDDDSVAEEGGESKSRDENKRSNVTSLELSAESDEEIRRLEKTRQLSGSENSETVGDNDIRRKKRVSPQKRKSKYRSIRKIRKRVKDVSPTPPRRLLKSKSKGVPRSLSGRKIILADKKLAGRICLQLKSGHIILTNAKEALREKRGNKLRSGKRIRKNLRRNKTEFRPESKRYRTRKKGRREENTLEEMESFLEELRERKEAAVKISEDETVELFPSANVPAKEAKFLDRVRAKRKAKLMACLDLNANSSRQRVAKEAKCLADMNRKVCDDSEEDEDDSSLNNEKNKSELLQKLKAETKAILLGSKAKPREEKKQILE